MPLFHVTLINNSLFSEGLVVVSLYLKVQGWLTPSDSPLSEGVMLWLFFSAGLV